MPEQIKTKPKIDDSAAGILNDEMKQNALSFISYLRENKLSFSRTTDAWKASFKGKGVCRIWISNEGWSVCPYADYTNAFECYILKENMQNIIMDNLFTCHGCHSHTCAPKGTEKTFVGHTKVYFGITVNNMCKHWDAYFRNPNEETINCIKKMIEYKKSELYNS